MCPIILLASGKGGTGKSTCAVNLGAQAARLGRRVLLVDADAGLRSLDLMLGISDRVVYDLGDVLNGRCEPARAIVQTDEPGLSLLSAPQSTPLQESAPLQAGALFPGPSADGLPADALPMSEFRRLCRGLAGYFDVLFIDSPAGLGAGARAAAAACTRALVVSTADPVCLRDADRTAGVLQEAGVQDIRLVLNRVRPRLVRRRLAPDLDAAIDGAALQLIGVVPEDEAVTVSVCEGRPLAPGRKGAARAFCNIAGRLEGRDIPLMKL